MNLFMWFVVASIALLVAVVVAIWITLSKSPHRDYLSQWEGE